MPYGKKARTVRAYDYGCLLPTAGSDAALDQMYRRVRFWNALVEWHEPHRQQRQALLRRLRAGPGVAKDERLRLTEGERALFKAIDEREHVGVLARKAESGLYWCNTDDVVVNFHNAVQRAKGQKLNFHSARRAIGKTVVRWQTGLPVGDAFAGDTRLRLAPLHSARWQVHGSSAQCTGFVGATQNTLYTMQIRVGSDGRAPVWLTIPVVLHRPLSAAGLIRQVSIHRERVGPHDGGNPHLWKAVFIVETPEEKPVPVGAGRVSIDIGWRLLWVKPEPLSADMKFANEAGLVQKLRVAYWRDDATGQVGEVRLPPRIVYGLQKCEALRACRDTRFNAARALLVDWLKQAEAGTVPDWLRAATVALAQWRSSERLAGVVWRWKDNRFPGDEGVYEHMETWRRRERHLWSYEANSRDQLLKYRLDQYRRFAAWIAKTYREVVLEDFDLRPVADLGKHAKELVDEARHQRVLAATSVFRRALENACAREGVTITHVKAQYTTRQCHMCDYTETRPIRELVYTCPNGHTWDQDYNAAIQIGRRAVLV